MIGSFLTRGLILVLGYVYPAYECFKTVERNKPEVEQLRFWCQYWILVAVLTIFERVGDAFISWLPMYSEAKLAFFVYLWYPKTRGTTYVYDSFLRPYVAEHETEIDRNLLELRARVGDMAVIYWQKASSYGQTRIFEVLQCIASQSSSMPEPAERQEARAPAPPPAPPSTRPDAQKQPSQPVSRAAVSPTPTEQDQPAKNVTPSAPPKAPASNPAAESPIAASGPMPAPTITRSQSEASSQLRPRREETMAGEAPPTVTDTNANPPSKEEMIMEDALGITRRRLRRTRTAMDR